MGGKWKAKNSRISCFLSIFQRKLWVNHNRFNPHMHKMGPRGHKPFSFGDHFYSEKMPESSGFMYSSILMLENI